MSILPLLVTLGLYVFIVINLQAELREALGQYYASWRWNPEGWAVKIVDFFTRLVLLLLSAVTFSFVAGIVSSPFNDWLAEGAERCATPPLLPIPSAGIAQQLRLAFIDLAKTLVAGVASLVALLFSWVPILNFFAFALAFLLLTFQYISYPQTRRRQDWRMSLSFLRRHFYACLGFGAAFSIFFAIPLLSSVALPVAVVAGTLLAARAWDSRARFPLK